MIRGVADGIMGLQTHPCLSPWSLYDCVTFRGKWTLLMWLSRGMRKWSWIMWMDLMKAQVETGVKVRKTRCGSGTSVEGCALKMEQGGLWAQECRQSPEAERGGETNASLMPTPWFLTSDLQNYKKINLCCLRPLSLWLICDSSNRKCIHSGTQVSGFQRSLKWRLVLVLNTNLTTLRLLLDSSAKVERNDKIGQISFLHTLKELEMFSFIYPRMQTGMWAEKFTL